MSAKFPIFKPNKSLFTFTKGHFLFVIAMLLFLTNIVFEFKKQYVANLFFLILLVVFFFLATKNFRYQKLNGILDGALQFYENHLMINQEIITIDAIFKINIQLNDYDGYIPSGRNSNFFNKSNGTNNQLYIITKDEKEIKIFFQRNFMQEEELLPFVYSLIKLHSIPFEKGYEIESLNNFFRLKLMDNI